MQWTRSGIAGVFAARGLRGRGVSLMMMDHAVHARVMCVVQLRGTFLSRHIHDHKQRTAHRKDGQHNHQPEAQQLSNAQVQDVLFPAL